MALFPPPGQSRIGIWPKILYTAFVAVLVPFYLNAYGPTNFLYFCDTALLVGMVALWTESPLLASMPAVGIIVPQILWCIDFIGALCGVKIIGMTQYMFDPSISLVARGLSLFHGWLPFVLLWMVYKLGYERKALAAWTVVAWALMCVCYFFMPAPPAPANDPNLPVNINYVFGMGDAAQTWMSGNLWFTLMIIGLPLLCFLPTHWALARWLPAARR